MRALVTMGMALALAACATAPSGRSQLLLVSDAEMDRMGALAFDQMKASDRLSTNAGLQRRARCVAGRVVAVLPAEWKNTPWEVQVFEDSVPNAFALPGGRIGVNTGMFGIARDQHQLAAVLAHEVAHVVFRHANERVSRSALAEQGMAIVGAYAGARTSPANTRTLLGLLGAGVQVGVLLPFSREQEREADAYGQELMARAGFDPNGAVELWQAMASAGTGGRVPQLLSTHPDPGNRIRGLAQRAPQLVSERDLATRSGRVPDCD